MILLLSTFWIWIFGVGVSMESKAEISDGWVYVFGECLQISKPALKDPKVPLKKYVQDDLIPHFQSHFEKIKTSSDSTNPLWGEMLSKIQKSSENTEFFAKLYGVVVDSLQPKEVEDLLLTQERDAWFYEHFYARHSQRISGSVGYD